MTNMMTFPATWGEYEQSYGITDSIYTNGVRLIPSFRVKQWLDHLDQKGEEPVIGYKLVTKEQAVLSSLSGEEVYLVDLPSECVTNLQNLCMNELLDDDNGIYLMRVKSND